MKPTLQIKKLNIQSYSSCSLNVNSQNALFPQNDNFQQQINTFRSTTGPLSVLSKNDTSSTKEHIDRLAMKCREQRNCIYQLQIYIEELENSHKEKEDQIQRLKQEIKKLKNIIESSQCSKASQTRQRYNEEIENKEHSQSNQKERRNKKQQQEQNFKLKTALREQQLHKQNKKLQEEKSMLLKEITNYYNCEQKYQSSKQTIRFKKPSEKQNMISNYDNRSKEQLGILEDQIKKLKKDNSKLKYELIKTKMELDETTKQILNLEKKTVEIEKEAVKDKNQQLLINAEYKEKLQRKQQKIQVLQSQIQHLQQGERLYERNAYSKQELWRLKKQCFNELEKMDNLFSKFQLQI